MAASVNLANKTFVITGGNSGIGLETARALLSKNAHVIVASRSRERGNAAVQELKQAASSEAKVECMQIDLASFRFNVVCCELDYREVKHHNTIHYLLAAQSDNLQRTLRSAACLCMFW